jgi:cyclohexadieny/prephenate dehydrogenase
MEDQNNKSDFIFQSITLIGIGLIGSSIARAIKKRNNLAKNLTLTDVNAEVRVNAEEIGLGDHIVDDLEVAVKDADCVILCTPIGNYTEIMQNISNHLKSGCIVSDVGSVKRAPIADMSPHIPDGVHLVPGHPIAGTEQSGPESGFAELFEGRYWLLTPSPETERSAIQRMRRLFEGVGAMVEEMDPDYHDKVLAITSHLPHLIAYTIVGTADDLEDQTQADVIRPLSVSCEGAIICAAFAWFLLPVDAKEAEILSLLCEKLTICTKRATEK